MRDSWLCPSVCVRVDVDVLDCHLLLPQTRTRSQPAVGLPPTCCIRVVMTPSLRCGAWRASRLVRWRLWTRSPPTCIGCRPWVTSPRIRSRSPAAMVRDGCAACVAYVWVAGAHLMSCCCGARGRVGAVHLQGWPRGEEVRCLHGRCHLAALELRRHRSRHRWGRWHREGVVSQRHVTLPNRHVRCAAHRVLVGGRMWAPL